MSYNRSLFLVLDIQILQVLHYHFHQNATNPMAALKIERYWNQTAQEEILTKSINKKQIDR